MSVGLLWLGTMPPSSPTPIPYHRTVGAWGAMIAIGTVAAYSTSLSGPLFFDDTASVVQNESIRQLWPLSKVLFAPEVAGTAGRPLLNLSYALNYAAGGLSPTGYHVVNLLIHVAAALALYGLVRRTLRLPWAKGRFEKEATWLAGLTALLWAVHPLQTESVTYISQRAESLVALFYLLTWYALVRAAEPLAERRWGMLSVAACVAGVLTKEIMATAPVVILIFDRVFLSASWSEVWAKRKKIYLGYAGAWIVLGGLMAESRLFSRGIGFGGMGALEYAKVECEAVALYLKLSVWPHPLVIDYGLTPARGGPHFIGGALVVVAWIAGVALLWKRQRAVAFAGIAVLAMLAPTSSVVPVVFQPMAEHRMYLPLAMILTVLVAVAYRWLGRKILYAGLGLVAGLGALTVVRNRDYQNEEAMWRDTVAKRPDNWRAYNALANVLFEQQRLTDGLVALEAALQINPREARLHNGQANVLSALGRLPEAAKAGMRAVELDPAYAEGHSSLALVLLKAGRVPEAVKQLENARQLKPESAEIRSNLCDALRQAGRVADAIVEGEAALRLKPDFAVAHCNLGLALVDAGKSEAAVAHYEEALRLSPNYLQARNNLGVTLMNLGRLPEAEAQLREAIRQKADYADAHNGLGIVLAKSGRLDEAGKEFETALRIQPGNAQALSNMKVLEGMKTAR
jgi:tetratricopeptide (TPR) repeat protein